MESRRWIIFTLCFGLAVSACSLRAGPSKERNATTEWTVTEVQRGKASWYGVRCNGGRHTASGERLVNASATAAHKTLPMNTRVRVTNLENGKSEIVRINNRGPYIRGRIIDVTEGVAKRIGFYKRGVVRVKVEVLKRHDED
jgi:rare lipoprotein A